MSYIYCFCFITLFFLSCSQKKSEIKNEVSVDCLHVDLSEFDLSLTMDTLDLTKILRITQKQYDSMQLATVKQLEGYYIDDLSIGKTLLENDKGKLITLQIIMDGELSEYLISYDSSGRIVDNILVAYEDMVEGYSQINSTIEGNHLFVSSINFEYDEDTENSDKIKSDTIIQEYLIDSSLKFIKQ